AISSGGAPARRGRRYPNLRGRRGGRGSPGRPTQPTARAPDPRAGAGRATGGAPGRSPRRQTPTKRSCVDSGHVRPTDNEAGTVAGGAAGRDSEPSWPARGPAGRRGGLGVGERVQLTDPKGRRHTITLAPGATFQTHRGYIRHDDLIGAPPGSVATTSGGVDYLALRPLLADHVL